MAVVAFTSRSPVALDGVSMQAAVDGAPTAVEAAVICVARSVRRSNQEALVRGTSEQASCVARRWREQTMNDKKGGC